MKVRAFYIDMIWSDVDVVAETAPRLNSAFNMWFQ